MTLVIRGIDEVPEATGTRIIHLSDFHLGKGRDPDEYLVLESILGVVEDLEPDVVVISGDLVHVPDDAVALDWIEQRLDELGAVCVVVPGNHDIADPDYPAAFTSRFGTFPRYETHAGVGFALFDSFCDLKLDEREAWELADLEELGHLSTGRVSGDQLERLVGELREPWLAVVHHHLHDEPANPRNETSMRPLVGADAFMTWCESFDCSAILHGHKHAYEPVVVESRTPVFRGGATTKLPSVFRVIDVSDDVEWYEVAARLEA